MLIAYCTLEDINKQFRVRQIKLKLEFNASELNIALAAAIKITKKNIIKN